MREYTVKVLKSPQEANENETTQEKHEILLTPTKTYQQYFWTPQEKSLEIFTNQKDSKMLSVGQKGISFSIMKPKFKLPSCWERKKSWKIQTS